MSAEEALIKKYEKAKALFDNGLIKEFKEIFDIVPYSIVCKKLKTNNERFKAKLENPMTLKIYELNNLAALLNIDSVALYALVVQGSPTKEIEV
jgi:hypothetical protein